MPIYVVHCDSPEYGEHEVHEEDCPFIERADHVEFVGYFPDCYHAIKKAKETYSNVNGCFLCSPECHEKKLFFR